MVSRQSQVAANRTRDTHPARPSHCTSTHRIFSHLGVRNQAAQRLLRDGVIQPKLTVNQPDDPFEREADRVASLVTSASALEDPEPIMVSMPASSMRIQRLCRECEEEQKQGPAIQRMCDGCKEEFKNTPPVQAKGERGATPPVAPSLASRIESLQHGGQALPTAVRNSFEPRFGYDFSRVRFHTDAVSTRALAARAYTLGRTIVFGEGQYSPDTNAGKKLLAHELTHVVQQGRGTTRSPALIQRAGDPTQIPTGFACPTDLAPSHPAGPDLRFGSEKSDITPAHTATLTTFRGTWVAAGGTDNILVHGFASTDGAQDLNWNLSCQRAMNVRAELIRLGIPAVRIDIVAHGASSDFGASLAANRHVVVETSSPGILPLPLITGTLTARDNFAGRSVTRFGVGEIIDLNFASVPPRPAADFGGLQWFLVSGGGTLAAAAPDGTGTYTAPAAAGPVVLELRVASGATAGRVISTHAITIVIPNGVRMVAVPGTAPNTSPTGGTIPAGTFGAGFLANVFVDPKDVSFQGVVFGEGTVAGVVTPAGSFLSALAGRVHPVNTFGPGHAGNATTGTPVSPPQDQISLSGIAPTGSFLGLPTCGASDVNFAIPWEFSVAGSPRTRFATANSHRTSTFFCNCTTEKGGAGPFCRRINGTTC